MKSVIRQLLGAGAIGLSFGGLSASLCHAGLRGEATVEIHDYDGFQQKTQSKSMSLDRPPYSNLLEVKINEPAVAQVAYEITGQGGDRPFTVWVDPQVISPTRGGAGRGDDRAEAKFVLEFTTDIAQPFEFRVTADHAGFFSAQLDPAGPDLFEATRMTSNLGTVDGTIPFKQTGPVDFSPYIVHGILPAGTHSLTVHEFASPEPRSGSSTGGDYGTSAWLMFVPEPHFAMTLALFGAVFIGRHRRAHVGAQSSFRPQL